MPSGCAEPVPDEDWQAVTVRETAANRATGRAGRARMAGFPFEWANRWMRARAHGTAPPGAGVRVGVDGGGPWSRGRDAPEVCRVCRGCGCVQTP
ncbi:hypothetical protein GCM10023336_24340 [Streptomyces similanensis]|uniref:Uncharacterized protein n=1 Tax=Streptomyces similanensis TaxID=1274988 RepID=A0ABP9KD48_9ACTN